MRLLTAIIKHQVAWNKDASLAHVRNCIEGVVDVKLAQFLSDFDWIIGADLAAEFRTLTHEAPHHSLEYSKAVVNEDFGLKYSLENSTLVGSGSIAQIHKLADESVVIKVVHPHANDEIRKAVDAYDQYRESWLIPAKLKIVCDVFFDGLLAQLDMRTETANMTHFPNGGRYVCPAPLDASERCLVMRYEPSTHLNTTHAAAVSDEVRSNTYHAINEFSNICLEHGWIHGDMHEGNFGIRHKDGRLESVVVYDFGFVYDLSNDIPSPLRKELTTAARNYDFERYKDAMIQVMGLDDYETDGMDLANSIEAFTHNMERFILYYFTLCELNPTSFKLMSSMEKYYPYAKKLIQLQRSG